MRHELPQRAKLKNDLGPGESVGFSSEWFGLKVKPRAGSTRARTLRHVRWHVKAQPRTHVFLATIRMELPGRVCTYTLAGVRTKGTLLATGSRPLNDS